VCGGTSGSNTILTRQQPDTRMTAVSQLRWLPAGWLTRHAHQTRFCWGCPLMKHHSPVLTLTTPLILFWI